jgi:hypothetical protein
MLEVLCVWTTWSPIGRGEIDPPEILVLSRKLHADLLKTTGLALDV